MDPISGDLTIPAEVYAGSLRLSPSASAAEADADLSKAGKEVLALEVPAEYTLVGETPPAEDQARRGTCATFAAALAASFVVGRDISEQHLYNRAWHRYQRSGGSPDDEGTSIEAALVSLLEEGACAGNLWDYAPLPLPRNLPQDPVPPRALNAEKLKIASWRALALPRQRKSEYLAKTLYSAAVPIMLSTSVFWGSCGWEEGFFIDMPETDAPERSDAFHAVVAIGYNITSRFLIIRNSWGLDWGVCGTGLMSFAYADRYVREAFAIGRNNP